MKAPITFLFSFWFLNFVFSQDSIQSWEFNCLNDSIVEKSMVAVAELSPSKIVEYINQNKWKNRIVLKYDKTSNDTIYILISTPDYLTQSLGTCGANEYMATTTYLLTELKSFNHVCFNFQEGDHAVPGVYDRKYFEDQRKRNNE